MEGRPRIAKLARVHRHRGAPPHRRPAALELVHREIHAVAKKGEESPLHTVLAHQPLQVAVLATGEL